MKFTPIGRKLAAALYEVPKKSGLILTPDHTPRDRFVIQSVPQNSLGLKAGDLILVQKHSALEREIEDEKVYIISLDHVLGVFE